MNDAKILYENWNLGDSQPHGFLNYQTLKMDPEWIEEENEREKRFNSLHLFTNHLTTQMKEAFKQGIPHCFRRRYWLVASGGFDFLMKYGDNYNSAVQSSLKYPRCKDIYFGSSPSLYNFFSESEISIFHELLHVIYVNNRHFLDFSPLITTTTAFLLLYMEPPLAYASIQSMIKKSKDDNLYFTLTTPDYQTSINAISDIIASKFKRVYQVINDFNISMNEVLFHCIPNIFRPYLPMRSALTIFDSFVSDGFKILTDITIGLLKITSEALIQTHDSMEFKQILLNFFSTCHSVDIFKKLLCKSYESPKTNLKYKLGRKASFDNEFIVSNNQGEINHMQINPNSVQTMIPQKPKPIEPILLTSSDHSTHINATKHYEQDPEELKMLLLMEKMNYQNMQSKTFAKLPPASNKKKPFNNNKRTTTNIQKGYDPTIPKSAPLPLSPMTVFENIPVKGNLLTDDLITKLRTYLPNEISNYKFEIQFSLIVHGVSLSTFYSLEKRKKPALIIIKTEYNFIGAFLSESPYPFNHKYFGNPTCFIFRGIKSGKDIEIWKAKTQSEGGNLLFIKAEPNQLMIGGPTAAIKFENPIKNLISFPCDTFSSPLLTYNELGDQIQDIELYNMFSPFE